MNSPVPAWAWIAFHIVVFGILALDLGVLSRKSKVPSVKTALCWTAFWIALSLGFCALIFQYLGRTKGLEWISAYILEYSLSVDNIFVFLLVFGYFAVPEEYQHKVLFWGVIGAFVMRAIMIFAGTAIIERFAWVELIFGAFLIYTAWKLAFGGETEVHPENNPALSTLRRFMPVTPDYVGSNFFTIENGKRAATPLLAVLLVIETTDLLFAVDSIPATLGVVKSRDTFVAYTANICAILGLRSLYFAVRGIMDLFHYLKYGLSVVLGFVGAKMIYQYLTHTHVPTTISLGVIVAVLGISILLSILRPKQPETPHIEIDEK
ncbi:MAG TPA: TerC family protein [Abditibacterium sp.]|jgi:tellurite resistance protein TerC